jgi:RNA polymerase sigma-70 factor, ECF subfamily
MALRSVSVAHPARATADGSQPREVARFPLDAMTGAGERETCGGTTRTAGTMTASFSELGVDFAPGAVLTPVTTFDEFITRYQMELYRYALQLTRKRADADDLYQETLLQALRDFDGLNESANHRAWLYRIATNAYLSSLRRSNHEKPLDGAEEHEDHAGCTTNQDDCDQLSEVAAFVDCLPPKQRVALVLRKYQGLGYDEIAASLDTSESAARADVHQALRELREQLNGRL